MRHIGLGRQAGALLTLLALAACGGGGLDAPSSAQDVALQKGIGPSPTLVVDARPGPSGSRPFPIGEFQERLYVVLDDGVSGRELWAYDGSTLSLVIDLNPGPASSLPSSFLIRDDGIYFTADDGTRGRELWMYDGTAVTLVDEPIPGPASSFPSNFAQLVEHAGELLVFNWDDGSTGGELWTWDGTGRTLVADIRLGTGGSRPQVVGEWEGRLYISADDGVVGRELWVYDGTDVTLVEDIRPGPLGSGPAGGIAFDGKFYLQANDGTQTLSDVFVYDGTSVAMAFDLVPASAGFGSAIPRTVFNGALYGQVTTPDIGAEIWRFDGVNPPEVSDGVPAFFQQTLGDRGVLDGELYLSSVTPATGRELWKIDADGNVTQVFDLNPGPGSSSPGPFAFYDGDWYFGADDGQAGAELWRAERSLNAAPDCANAVASVAEIWPPNHEMVEVTVLGVSDPDGDDVVITIDAIHQDEPVRGAGSGNTSPDASGVGTSTAQVRAERAGTGDGRVYHIAFTATDGNGGSCSGVVQVAVPHSKAIAAVDGGPLYDASGE